MFRCFEAYFCYLKRFFHFQFFLYGLKMLLLKWISQQQRSFVLKEDTFLKSVHKITLILKVTALWVYRGVSKMAFWEKISHFMCSVDYTTHLFRSDWKRVATVPQNI